MKCDECPMRHNGKWVGHDDDWCPHNLYSSEKWQECPLTPADFMAINIRLRGGADRLVPMTKCESCDGRGEVWNPERYTGLETCASCKGHGFIEDWTEEEDR